MILNLEKLWVKWNYFFPRFVTVITNHRVNPKKSQVWIRVYTWKNTRFPHIRWETAKISIMNLITLCVTVISFLRPGRYNSVSTWKTHHPKFTLKLWLWVWNLTPLLENLNPTEIPKFEGWVTSVKIRSWKFAKNIFAFVYSKTGYEKTMILKI